MTEISIFFTFWTKNFGFLFFDPDHLETYNAPIGPLEAKILSRRHFSETCWPRVVSTELALGKLFHENGCNFGTVGRTTLAQVAKRPWEQGLPARPFRWSVFLLVSLSGFVIASVCIFIGFGQKSYFNPGPKFFGWNGPCMGQGPLQWILVGPIDVPWVVQDQESTKKLETKWGEREEGRVSVSL